MRMYEGEEKNKINSNLQNSDYWGGGWGKHSVIKVRGTSDGRKSLDNDTSQVPRDTHMDAARQKP